MNKSTLYRLLKILIVIGDVFSILISAISSYYIRFYTNLIPIVHGIPETKYYIYSLPVFIFVLLLSLNYAGLYRERREISIVDEFLLILISISFGTLFLLSVTFFIRGFSFSRIVIILTWFFNVIFIFIWRIIYRKIFFYLSKKEIILQKIAIVGTTDISKILIERLKRIEGTGYTIIGCFDNNITEKEFSGIPILGKVKDLNKFIKENKVDEVFIGLTDFNREELAELIMENEKIQFKIALDVLSIITKKMDFGEIFGIPVFEVKELPLNKLTNRAIKRTFDFVVSLFSLIIFSPLFLIIAILIKLESEGPVLYKQERVGRDNKIFIIYKFRTMTIDAEKHTGPVWAKEDDPRRTKIGKILRKTSLDELPQLINVLKGEMSIVGPRPERPHFVNKFKDVIPRYMERHKVKAGITGWAQINGLRGNTSLEERVKYDLYYIENWSLWFDIKIIIRTILEVFHHTTAY